MLRHPPLIETVLTPEEIIGFGNMSDFTAYVRGYRPENKHNHQMGEILRRLRDNGFYPNGFTSDGKVFFATVLKSQLQQIFEGPELESLKKLPISKMMEMARAGYRKIMKKMDDPFAVEPWQVQAEDYETMDYRR
jgi:hypothetical protein